MDWKERANAKEAELRGQFLAALDGDAAAYRRFLDSVASHLRAFFRRRMQQFPDDIEDLVQETLLAIHRARHTYSAAQPVTAWLHTIARYKLIDLMRAHGRREALNDPLEDDLEIVSQSDDEAPDSRHDLEKVLELLPPHQREILMMTKIEGASVAQVSAATGMTQSAIKVSVHRSMKALAAKLRGTR